MIRIDRIYNEIFGGVGWQQSTLSSIPVLDSENLQSDSGLVFQDNTFVNLENIYDCQHDVNITPVQFNSMLKAMQKSAILQVIQKVIPKQSDLLQSVNLYPYEKTFKKTYETENKFIGFKIEKLQNNIANKSSFIELSFNADVTFYIYLYNSNDPKTYVKRKEITTVAGKSVQVSLPDWIMSDNENVKGGNWYVGYFEDDLQGAKPYKLNFRLANLKKETKYFYAQPVSIEHENKTIDVEKFSNLSDPRGINLCIESYTDFSELIIRNKNMFWSAIQYQMQENVLQLITTSTRSNSTRFINESNIDDIKFQIYGNQSAGIDGIKRKLQNEIDDIKHTLFYQPKIFKTTIRHK